MFAKSLDAMRRSVLSALEAAGFARWGFAGLLARLALVFAATTAFVFVNSRLLVFSLCIAVLAVALAVELLYSRASSRRRVLAKVWPEVLDSLASAEAAGINLIEAFADLAEHAPIGVRPSFVRAVAELDAGLELDQVLVRLKAEFGSVYSDRMVELLRMVNQLGANEYHRLLREQSRNLRADLALWAAVETKQSWVLGVAKLAITAPWLIVALLSSRAENATVYGSSAGASTLLVGLVVSAFAYYLIHLLGALPAQRRVLQ